MATSSDEEDYHLQYALQLASASTLPMVFKAVIELGVLEIIEKAGPAAMLSASQIASQLPTQNNPDAPIVLDRILSLLASHSILTCSLATENQDSDQIQRLYGLAPVAKYFIRKEDGGSLSPYFRVIHDKVIMDLWYHLKDVVLQGGVLFQKAYGMSSMEYVKKDPRFGEVFGGFVRGFNPLFMKRILDIYDGFEGLTSLVDVGGGDGSVLNMIVSKYPAIKGINFDLASVIENSPSYPGIEHVAGDVFLTIPEGEAIFMKWVSHFFSDDNFLKVLKNCYGALPDNGKLIVVEMVIPEIPGTSAADRSLLQNYLFVTTMNPKRNERTEKDFERLAKVAGFSHFRVACSACTFSVVEFVKNTATAGAVAIAAK
ncbi:O-METHYLTRANSFERASE [Salix koriyanagi]|uniref:O-METHYLTRANSFERASE n=1 Tax=Salix koriyanagi TaxID=2511006 RepID=A0A9Q0X074_9ROSI|nr:O-METHYLTRANSFERASE [Salix koriyanagi]